MVLADEGLFPAGEFHCPRCFCMRDFVVAVDEGGTPEEEAPPLECYVCGYVLGHITQEADPVTGTIHQVPVRKPAVPKELREQKRLEVRRRFVSDVLRDGARRENFTRRRRS